jgi:hypothetical protein
MNFEQSHGRAFPFFLLQRPVFEKYLISDEFSKIIWKKKQIKIIEKYQR